MRLKRELPCAPVTAALLDSGRCRTRSRLRTLSVFWVLSWPGRRRLSRGGRQDPQAQSGVTERQAHTWSAMHPPLVRSGTARARPAAVYTRPSSTLV